MFTSDQINSWIAVSRMPSAQNENPDPCTDSVLLKRTLLEGKIQIDRWGVTNITTDIIFHSSRKNLVRDCLKGDGFTEVNDDSNFDNLYGSDVHYLDKCPIDTVVMVCLDPEYYKWLNNDSRSVVSFLF